MLSKLSLPLCYHQTQSLNHPEMHGDMAAFQTSDKPLQEQVSPEKLRQVAQDHLQEIEEKMAQEVVEQQRRQEEVARYLHRAKKNRGQAQNQAEDRPNISYSTKLRPVRGIRCY